MSVGDVLVAIIYAYWHGVSYPVSVYYSYRYMIRWYCTEWYGMAALGIIPWYSSIYSSYNIFGK